MSSKGSSAKGSEGTARSGSRLGEFLPAIIFVLILALGLGTFLFTRAQSAAKRATAVRANEKQGLPSDFPSEIVPLYAGATITETLKDTTESREGEPMDRWIVHAWSPEEPKKIYEFYNELLLGKGMAQQMYISIPGGYGVDFADQYQVVNFIIEKSKDDPAKTNLEITFNRLQSYRP